MNKIKRKEAITPKVIIVSSHEDIYKCLNFIEENKQIIINITSLSNLDKYRFIDFLSGYIYARKGKREKIEDNIYTFSIKGY